MHDAVCTMRSTITKSNTVLGKSNSNYLPNPTHHVASTLSDLNAAVSCPAHSFTQQMLRTEHAVGLAL